MQTKYELPYKLMLVTWWDALCENKWGLKEELTGPEFCVSLGWLVRDEDDWIALAGTIAPSLENQTEEVDQVIMLPKGMIATIQEVTPNEVPGPDQSTT